MRNPTVPLVLLLALLASPGAAEPVLPFQPGAPGPGEGEGLLSPLPELTNHGILKVALDPGHGGKDQGAKGASGTLEKELTARYGAALSQALAEAGFTVVLTRGDDSFVALPDRTGIANQAGADLLVSLHFNASSSRDIRGVETFYLSPEASDADAATLAGRENSADGGTAAAPLPGLDAILWDMAQNEFAAQSSEFAGRLQKRLVKELGGLNRGARAAPMHVLKGARMPAVLVEVGFLTNAEEEGRLTDEAFRAKVVRAMVEVIREYSQVLVTSGSPAEPKGGGL